MKFATTLFAAALSVQSATAAPGARGAPGCLFKIKQQGGSHLASICIEFGTAGAVGVTGTLYGNGDFDRVDEYSNMYKISLRNKDESSSCDAAVLSGTPWGGSGTVKVSRAVCKDLRAI